MNGNSIKIFESLLSLNNYCTKLCFEKRNLNEFKDCLCICKNSLELKIQAINNNIDSFYKLVEGRYIDRNTENTYKTSKKSFVNKYIYEDYYYLTSPDYDIGKPSEKEVEFAKKYHQTNKK